MSSKLLTVDEVSEILKLHPQTVYFMTRKGQLPFLKIGRVIRFDKLELELWIKKKMDENNEKVLQISNDGC